MDKNLKRSAGAELDALCAALDERGWDYDKDKDNFSVGFLADGADMPLSVSVKINPELMTLTAFIVLPFETPEDMDESLAVALALINCGIIHGNFDYDKAGRRLLFRASTSYRDSTLDKDVYFYLIAAAFSTADKIAATLKALCDKIITVEQMIEALAR